jgi:hypothetical protein
MMKLRLIRLFTKLAYQLPNLIGLGVVIIIAELITLILRFLGLEKGFAIYVAIVTTCIVLSIIFSYRIRKDQAASNTEEITHE